MGNSESGDIKEDQKKIERVVDNSCSYSDNGEIIEDTKEMMVMKNSHSESGGIKEDTKEIKKVVGNSYSKNGEIKEDSNEIKMVMGNSNSDSGEIRENTKEIKMVMGNSYSESGDTIDDTKDIKMVMGNSHFESRVINKDPRGIKNKVTEEKCKLATENHILDMNLDAEKCRVQELQNQAIITEKIIQDIINLRTELLQNEKERNECNESCTKTENALRNHANKLVEIFQHQQRQALEQSKQLTAKKLSIEMLRVENNMLAEKLQVMTHQQETSEKIIEDNNITLGNLSFELLQIKNVRTDLQEENVIIKEDLRTNKLLIEKLQLEHSQAMKLQSKRLLAEKLSIENLKAENIMLAEKLQVKSHQQESSEKIIEDNNSALETLRAELLQIKNLRTDLQKENVIIIEDLQTNKLLIEKLQLEHSQAMELQSKQLLAEKLSIENLKAENITLAEKLQVKTHQQESSEKIIEDNNTALETLRAELLQIKNLRTDLQEENVIIIEDLQTNKLLIEKLQLEHSQAMELQSNQLLAEKLSIENLKAENIMLAEKLQVKIHQQESSEKIIEDNNTALETLRAELLQIKNLRTDLQKENVIIIEDLQTNKLLIEKLQLEHSQAMELQSKQLLAEKQSVEKLKAENTKLAEKLQVKNQEASTSTELLCRNARFGCTYLVTDDKLHAHSKACFFRFLVCPLHPCSWRGIYNNLYSHAKDVHVCNTNMVFGKFVEVPLARDTQVLQNGRALFLMHCRAATDPDGWAWRLQVIGSPAEAAKWRYEVNISDPREPKRKMTISDKCLSDCKNIEQCATIPQLVLKNYLSNNRVSLRLCVYKTLKI